MRLSSWRRVALIVPALLVVAAAQEARLKIVVIEGQDSVNIIDRKTAVAPVVEVRDENDLPVVGVLVRFAINGQNAVFQNGARVVTVTTNSVGRAAVSQLNPLTNGTFQIQVQASYQGQIATATIQQTNFATAAQAATGPTGGSSTVGSSTGAADPNPAIRYSGKVKTKGSVIS